MNTWINMYTIQIDSNNSHIITQLSYYLLTNHKDTLEKQCTDYVLEDRRTIKGKDLVMILPQHTLEILYEDKPIGISYERTRSEPSNFHTTIVRFDLYRVSSKDSLEHVSNFLNMIGKLSIPTAAGDELSKYVWDCDDRCWFYSNSFKPRKMETIYLPEKQEIVDTLSLFLNDKKRQELYESLDIPSKHVFLFYGLPGTGKTSMIRALASHFKYNLSVIKNSPKITDQTLEMMLNKLHKRTFVVFEDIDCMFDNRDVKNHIGITYSGLLNMLDGINHYDKLVVFITTNVIQNLDSAFRRRVDMFIEFSYIQKRQILDMHRTFFESDPESAEGFYQQIKSKKLTVNMLEKYFIYCLGHQYDPKEHLKALNDYTEKTGTREISDLYF